MLTAEKTDLRQILRNSRKEFVLKRYSSNFETTKVAKGHLDGLIAKAGVVAGYMAVGSEADPIDIMTSYASSGTNWCLPWLADRDSPMVFRSWSPGQPTELAPGGFRQPLSSSPIATPDFILLPLIGFDRSGSRLGQGAGHYDRALTRMPAAYLVGIAWSVQEVEHLPADPWDVPLDAVLTEAEWIVPAHSRLERD